MDDLVSILLYVVTVNVWLLVFIACLVRSERLHRCYPPWLVWLKDSTFCSRLLQPKKESRSEPQTAVFFCVFCFLVACVLMEAKEGEEHGHRAQAFVKAFNQALAKTLETAR